MRGLLSYAAPQGDKRGWKDEGKADLTPSGFSFYDYFCLKTYLEFNRREPLIPWRCHSSTFSKSSCSKSASFLSWIHWYIIATGLFPSAGFLAKGASYFAIFV